MADTSPARPRPWLRSEATLTKSPHRLTKLQEHLTQRWPDTFILTRAPRQSRSDRRHSTAPLTSLTEGQRRLRHSDCSATRQSESDRQSGLAKGATANSAPPDPRARTRAKTRKTANSAPPDPRARTRAKTRKTTKLRLARPQGSDSALASAERLPPRPTPWLGLGHGNGRQTQPRLRRNPHVALPRAQTATSTGSAIIILPRIDSGHGEQDRRPIRPAPPEGQ